MDLSSLFDNSFVVVATVKDFDVDFALSFDFGAAFDAGFGNFDGSVIVQFDNSSLGSSLFRDGEPSPHPVWHQRCPNCHYQVCGHYQVGVVLIFYLSGEGLGTNS